MRLEWKGPERAQDARKAARLAVTRLGIGIVSEALPHVHIVSGTLARSQHVAPPGADHSDDFARAGGGTRGGASLMSGVNDAAIANADSGQIVCSVGSWLTYALIIELRFPYLIPAFESARRNLPALLRQAGAEVGL